MCARVFLISSSTSIFIAFDETKLWRLAAAAADASSTDSPRAELAVGMMRSYLATQFLRDQYVYGSDRWGCYKNGAPIVAKALTTPEPVNAYRAVSEVTGQEQVHELPSRTHAKQSSSTAVVDVDVLWFKIDTPANLAVTELYTHIDMSFENHESVSGMLASAWSQPLFHRTHVPANISPLREVRALVFAEVGLAAADDSQLLARAPVELAAQTGSQTAQARRGPALQERPGGNTGTVKILSVVGPKTNADGTVTLLPGTFLICNDFDFSASSACLYVFLCSWFSDCEHLNIL
jgi:hypothetical protein